MANYKPLHVIYQTSPKLVKHKTYKEAGKLGISKQDNLAFEMTNQKETGNNCITKAKTQRYRMEASE